MPSFGGFAPGGGGAALSAAQTAKLNSMGVDGYPLLTTIDTDNVTDGIPHGWNALGPSQASGLTVSTAITASSGKVCTLLTDHLNQYRLGEDTPGGIGFIRAHSCVAFVAEVTLSGIDCSNLAAGKYMQFSVGESYGSGNSGAWAAARFFYGTSESPKWWIHKSFCAPHETNQTNGTATTVSASDTPSSVRMRYESTRDGFKVYFYNGSSWDEVGGGSVPTGAYDWMSIGTVPGGEIRSGTLGHTRKFFVELSTTETFGTPANGPTLTIDSLTFSGVE